jgi:hypothetical protein
MNRASVWGGWCHTVGEDLVIVLIFLIADSHFGVMNVRWWGREGHGNSNALGILEDKVLGNEGHQIWPVPPKRVVDEIVEAGRVFAPLPLAKASVATQEGPVHGNGVN